MVNGGTVTVRATVTVAVWAGEAESVTLKVSGAALAALAGVPLINPLDAPRVRPLGKVPPVNDQLYGAVPPVAARACE